MKDISKYTKPVIGLLGGIGAGKSTVAGLLGGFGCAVVDGDAIGHELLRRGDVRDEIRSVWGQRVFTDGDEVDRAALGRIVFGDAEQLQRLNGILHPRIGAGITAAIAEAQGDPDVAAVVVDAAVLIEAGWDQLCTHLVFIDAPESARRSRAVTQRRWSERALAEREKSQISLDIKARKCDYTLSNNSTVPHLHEQVRQLLSQIIHAADRRQA